MSPLKKVIRTISDSNRALINRVNPCHSGSDPKRIWTYPFCVDVALLSNVTIYDLYRMILSFVGYRSPKKAEETKKNVKLTDEQRAKKTKMEELFGIEADDYSDDNWDSDSDFSLNISEEGYQPTFGKDDTFSLTAGGISATTDDNISPLTANTSSQDKNPSAKIEKVSPAAKPSTSEATKVSSTGKNPTAKAGMLSAQSKLAPLAPFNGRKVLPPLTGNGAPLPPLKKTLF